MGYTDFTQVLSRLLSDPHARAEYAVAPDGYIQQFVLSDQDRQSLLSIDIAQLNKQANLLINKRLREVAHLLPQTLKMQGEGFAERFRYFAQQYWPSHYRRHETDALQFCRYLKLYRQPVSLYELYRLSFLLGRKPFALYLSKDNSIRQKTRKTLLLFVRWRNIQHEWQFYFSL